MVLLASPLPHSPFLFSGVPRFGVLPMPTLYDHPQPLGPRAHCRSFRPDCDPLLGDLNIRENLNFNVLVSHFLDLLSKDFTPRPWLSLINNRGHTLPSLPTSYPHFRHPLSSHPLLSPPGSLSHHWRYLDPQPICPLACDVPHPFQASFSSTSSFIIIIIPCITVPLLFSLN